MPGICDWETLAAVWETEGGIRAPDTDGFLAMTLSALVRPGTAGLAPWIEARTPDSRGSPIPRGFALPIDEFPGLSITLSYSKKHEASKSLGYLTHNHIIYLLKS